MRLERSKIKLKIMERITIMKKMIKLKQAQFESKQGNEFQ